LASLACFSFNAFAAATFSASTRFASACCCLTRSASSFLRLASATFLASSASFFALNSFAATIS
jgi:hypothetical protein